MLAINILSSQFPKSDIMTPANPVFKKIKEQTSKKNLDEILIQPVILKSQLYSMVKNRTEADRELVIHLLNEVLNE